MKFILSVAIGIILMHGIVSHEHNPSTRETLAIQSHECSTTLFEGVKLTFGLDHGDGHLEQFVKVPFEMPNLQLLNIISIDYSDNIQPFIDDLVGGRQRHQHPYGVAVNSAGKKDQAVLRRCRNQLLG